MTTASVTLTHFIGGRDVAGISERYSECVRSATGEVSGRTPLANLADVRRDHCRAPAFPAWSGVTALNRARILFKFKALLELNADDIARAITAEHGKVFSDARGEVTRGIEGSSLPAASRTCSGRAFDERRRRRGIVTPNWRRWRGRRHHAVQLPVHGPDGMFPVALACGNTFVLSLPNATRPRRSSARLLTRQDCRRVSSTWYTATRRQWMPCWTIRACRR